MTWYFDVDGTKLDIYDHTGTQVRSGLEFNGVWSGYPEIVLDVMADVYDSQSGEGNSQYRQDLVRDAALEDIKEGTP